MSAQEPENVPGEPFQKELGIPDPSPIAKQISLDPSIGTVNAQYNYHVNLPAVQLPSWEEFSKYPQDVREFLMRAGEKEQDARHNWIKAEQTHRHQFDHNRLIGTFNRQRLGQVLGACLSCFCITAGTLILIAGKNPWGFAAILAGITPLVGMAVYAKNVSPPPMQGEEPQDELVSGEKPPATERQ